MDKVIHKLGDINLREQSKEKENQCQAYHSQSAKQQRYREYFVSTQRNKDIFTQKGINHKNIANFSSETKESSDSNGKICLKYRKRKVKVQRPMFIKIFFKMEAKNKNKS